MGSLPVVCLLCQATQVYRGIPILPSHGRNANLPTKLLSHPQPTHPVDVMEYCTELTTGLTTAWKMAKENVVEAQTRYKIQHDKKSKEPCYILGDRIFIHMPHEQLGKRHKLARPYYGPYRVEAVTPTNMRAIPVDDARAVR